MYIFKKYLLEKNNTFKNLKQVIRKKLMLKW